MQLFEHGSHASVLFVVPVPLITRALQTCNNITVQALRDRHSYRAT